MKTLWCWRCKMDVPMLNKEEFKTAKELYSIGFKNTKPDRFQPLLDYYNSLTDFKETEPAAIMHHEIDLYGSLCKKCGKPFRSPVASFCATCGNKEIQ